MRVETTTLGFACHWNDPPESTWSGTPWNLRAALAGRVSLVDLGFQLPRWQRVLLRAATTRRRDGRWVTTWRQSRVADERGQRILNGAIRRTGVDVALQVQDLAPLATSYLVVQDLSYDLLLENLGPEGVAPHFPGLGRSIIQRRRDRQLAIYQRAAMLLPMSHWLADSLVRSGIDAGRIRVVNPGVRASDTFRRPVPDRLGRPRRRLLFLGRDFHTKAGDQVVAATAILRREYDPTITLTVAGPKRWPLDGTVPEGVSFLGPVPRDDVASLYDSHDVFVMPSRFEGFGIAFVEALSRGLPCIGRDACAMPEIITPGATGSLVGSDSPTELADTIAGVLTSPAIFERCRAEAAETRERYSWDRAAREVLAAVKDI